MIGIAAESAGTLKQGVRAITAVPRVVRRGTGGRGSMLSTGFAYIRRSPWVVVAPGAAIRLLVLSFNFLGDALRDILDPRPRGKV